METEVVEQNAAVQGATAKRESLRPAYVLSTIVAVLTATVSAAGLLFPAWGNGMSWRGGLVTLAVAVILMLAIICSGRGSVRARLVWLGALYFIFNSYAFHVLGVPVTRLYLPLYLPMIAAFALSGLALAYGLFSLDTGGAKPDLVAPPCGLKPASFRAAYVFSAIVAVVAAMASVIGLLFPSWYGANWGNGTASGNDLVTLVVAVPVLALAITYSARGSVRARLVWLGALYYMVYNYAFYVFGIPVTRLYVPWIAVFALSGIALSLGMFNLDTEAIGRSFSPRTPARPIAGYLFFAGAMVSFLWISLWVKFLATGKIPEVNGSQEAYKVIAAVDLSFAVPLLISAAWALWRRRPWGYVLGVVALVQFSMYFAVMGTVCVIGWKLTPGSQLFSDWFINCVVTFPTLLLCLAGLLVNVRKAAESAQPSALGSQHSEREQKSGFVSGHDFSRAASE